MARQSILVYLSEEDAAVALLDVAATLARRDQSHVIGVYVVPALTIHPMMGAEFPGEIYQAHLDGYLEKGRRIEEIFLDALRREDFVSEWRVVHAQGESIASALADHARCADLVIAPHYKNDDDHFPFQGVTEELTMDSGRPVMMVPLQKNIEEVGKRIMVAWDGSRESTRAVFDSIELLQAADMVHIVSVDEEKKIGARANLPAAEIATALARRGVKCETDHIAPEGMSIGDAILARVGDRGCDLLVMGMYGHSKLSELVFGGVTRKVLQNLTIPVLMSR